MIKILQERWRVQFLLPLKYNDGRDIEVDKFDWVRTELLDKFGGFTIYPFSLEGGWIHPTDNIKFFDRTKLFEITIKQTDENETYLKNFKEELKKKFSQHEIYMTVNTVNIV